MNRRAPVVLCVVVTALAVAQGCHRDAAPPLGLTIGKGGPITFPATDEGWSERLPLPERATALTLTDTRVKVTEPEPDAAGHFEMQGQVLRLAFSESLVDMSKDAQKKTRSLPVIKITPAIAGRTVWTYGSLAEFRAEKPFDPEQTYTVELPELTAASGHTLEGGFKATFRADPIVTVAGKTITYFPKPGHARPVAISPRDVREIGGSHAVTIVYDQPVELALANQLVSLDVPFTLTHPPASAFEGQKVDPRFVLLAVPKGALAAGSMMVVHARAQDDADAASNKDASYTIAKPSEITAIRCAGNECEVHDGVVKGDYTSSIRVSFNNPLDVSWETLKKRVSITPAPKNAYFGGYDGLSINGSFEPSTRYTVRVAAMKDEYGGTVAPFSFTFQTRRLSASTTMAEGVTLLDEPATRAFPVTTRNVKQGELLLWALPKGDGAAYGKALHDATGGDRPAGDPIVVPFTPRAAENRLIETNLDLDQQLERGRAYVAQVRAQETLPDTQQVAVHPGLQATSTATAVLFAAGPAALAAHVHRSADKAAVAVFRLASGEPVAGARVAIGAASGTTDASGTALLDAPEPPPGEEAVLTVSANDSELMMTLNRDALASSALFPELTVANEEKVASDASGLVLTDRGVYRPGSKMFVKAFVRHMQNAYIAPIAGKKVRLRVVDPMGKDVTDLPLVTTGRGTIGSEAVFAKDAHTGRYQVRLEEDDAQHTLIAAEQVRVAEFEPPRFKVDVAGSTAAKDPTHLSAKIEGRYLFGAPMGGAHVSWVIKKTRIPVKGGALADAGLSFEKDRRDWWDEESEAKEPLKPVTGEGTLKEDGSLDVDAVLGALADGPTEITLEADVNDASARHVSGAFHTTTDPMVHHAGLALSRSFGSAGEPLNVELGVVDRDAHSLPGQKVTARLERLRWTRATEKGESGALIERWRYEVKVEASCEVVSAAKPVACDLPVTHGGAFHVVASVDGQDQADTSFWAYGNYSSVDDRAVPSQGKKVPLVLDKAHYQSGETAKLLVQSPFAKATALVTFEQGASVTQRTVSVVGPSATIDVPLTSANAPWLHVAVTLLPLGEREADYRVGVVRIPVGSDDAKLEVKVTSNQKAYAVRDDAEITIEVKKGGQPVRNADVTLGVVDEGVLRMTAYHPKDPVTALRPGRSLQFIASDSRVALLRHREKAHTAGGGDSEGEDALDTRKNFVETAAWVPDLVTDENGRITTKVKLPDNLTEFRMTAVVLDERGNGGVAESSFTVTKPLLLEPVMPRFALLGDSFEAAALVHNNTDAAVSAQVTVAGERRDVTIAPKNSARVAVPMRADVPGTRTLHFALAVNGALKDAVDLPLRTDQQGIEEHPMESGVFGAQQEIHLAIPGDARFEEGATLSIKTGSALYPELGQRLSYLLDYPHGCVEQTTSSTIPLIAARTILPWTGTTGLADAELKKRIEAGVARLVTMQTASGGLAYWPGGDEPNTFGTAYALRALVRAQAMGIEHPHLIEGMTKYLTTQLSDQSSPGLRMSVAEALALAHALPDSSADSLFDQHEKLDAFGLASLALALASLPNQDSRITTLLDQLETAFDNDGAPLKAHDGHDWHYWGSSDRDRAQTVIALSTLRRSSKLLPLLATRLTHTLEQYSTQSTAWSLLALSDYIGTRAPEGNVDVSVKLEGKILDTFQKLGGDNKEVRVPLADLAGKTVTVRLDGDAKTPSAFAVEARYKRPLEAGGTRLARRAAKGVSIHRAYSDAAGKEVDLANVKAGQVVRVAVRIDLPKLDRYRLGYLAVTDRLPAGFEPMNTDLATTGSIPELAKEHPFYEGLSGYGSPASHMDLRDDRVQLYFDRVAGDGNAVFASYLARATTPGTFTVPPANGELMYEADSEGYTDALKVVVK